jgi:hypothetical protein
MAVNFLNNLDLNGNQLLNARLQVLASDPGSAVAGDIIYNSSSNVFKFYNGSDWVDPSAGSYTSWSIVGDGGSSSLTVSNGETVDFAGGTGLSTSLAAGVGTRTMTFNVAEATATARGGIELFSDTDQSVAANSVTTTASRTYGLQLNSAGQGVVNVPWTDTSGMTSWNANIFGGATGPFTIGQGGDLTIKPGSNMDISLAGSNDAANYTIGIADSGVTAASYTNASITVNAKGLITSASSGSDTNTTYTLPTSLVAANTGAITLTGSDGSTDAVNFAGTTNEVQITQPTSGVLAIGLPDNVTLAGDLTVSGGDITLGGTGRIQGIDTVSAGTDAVNKTYVDNAVVGNLVFQGGYDAATNTPDLDSSPSSSIKKGWAYVVTAAGSFFTETVEVGDFLFAQSDAPTTLADWVTVQNNVGLATATTVGIGNVAANNSASTAGMAVAYSAGTATIGWSIKNLSLISNAIVDADRMAILDMTGFEQKSIELSTLKTYFQAGLSQGFAGTSSSGTTHTFNHNLNTYDVIVQVYDASNYETVYASVDRTSVNQVVVTTAASANIRCLINNVG